jgi:anti-sigma B factor antagonist
MEIRLRRSGQFHVIEIEGEIDFYSAFRLRNVVKKMIAKKIDHLIIDLEEVPYVDSSAVGTLVSAHAEAEKKGRSLLIMGVQGSVKRALDLTRLTGSLPIVSNLEEAAKCLGRRSGDINHA